MILKLKSILPNPFRDLKSNPLIEEKILELVESINLTGFWDNVVCRKNTDGKYELAYGHHRLAAAIRAGLVEADFIVKSLDDATMIQIMDNENRDTYGSTPASLMESVKAIVKALAVGTIKPFVIDPKTNDQHIRYAPSFVPGKPSSPSAGEHPYTALCISQFLGRARKGGREANTGIIAALDALYLKERGRFSSSLLTTKDKTGAKVPITASELVKITSDIKRDVEQADKRLADSKKQAAELDAQQRRIDTQRKEAESKAEEERHRLVKQLAEAKRKEDEKKASKIKAQLKEKAEETVETKLAFDVARHELEEQVEKRRKEEEAARRVDAYLPIRREAERILHKLEGSTSTGKEALTEEVKALAKLNLNGTDRERLRQAALTMGTFYTDWVAMQFLPPLSVKKSLSEYRSREEARRRVDEAKAEAKRLKEEAKAKKGKSK